MDKGGFFSGAVRVLVVDDNHDQVLILMALLREEGYETRGAYDGKAALAAIAEFDPDVVVADIGMPGMTGWELARQVRPQPGGQRPLLIAMSGEYQKSADKLLAQMAGFKHYLMKPCDPGELLKLLRTAASAGRRTDPGR
jgi:CheY-like chemotaxis protein